MSAQPCDGSVVHVREIGRGVLEAVCVFIGDNYLCKEAGKQYRESGMNYDFVKQQQNRTEQELGGNS